MPLISNSKNVHSNYAETEGYFTLIQTGWKPTELTATTGPNTVVIRQGHIVTKGNSPNEGNSILVLYQKLNRVLKQWFKFQHDYYMHSTQFQARVCGCSILSYVGSHC